MTEDRVILVTCAAGKTGLAVIRALARRGVRVRALVRRADQVKSVRAAGAVDVLTGDLADPDLFPQAMRGVSAVYLLFPNMHPHEADLGLSTIAAAKKSGVRSVVYHSVLFPQIEAMPHHWQKLRVEEALIQSGLDFTILQPASYMQNIKASWDTLKKTGNYLVPYSIQSEFSPIDLNDVADAACLCLLDSGHAGAIYQLAGPERLTSIQMAQAMGKALGRQVLAVQQPLEDWAKNARSAGLSSYAIDTLTNMFIYYDKHGLSGSPKTFERLVGRPATSFSQYLETLVK